MNKLFAIILAVGFLTACNTNGGSFSESKINMIFSAGTPARSAANQTEEISAVYFETITATLHQSTPGYYEDMEIEPYDQFRNDGSQIVNWAHQVIISGAGSQNRVLKNNEAIAAADWLKEYEVIDPFETGLGERYLSTYSTFRVDFIEVTIQTPSIITGVGESAQLWGKENCFLREGSEYADILSTNKKEVEIRIDGTNMREFMPVFFARDDWYPEAMHVSFTGVNGSYTFASATGAAGVVDLNDEQTERLESLVNNSYGGFDYSTIIIIPFDGPIVQALTDEAEGVKDLTITVKFDFTNFLTEESHAELMRLMNGGEYTSPERFYLKLDEQGVPFGLKLGISWQ